MSKPDRTVESVGASVGKLQFRWPWRDYQARLLESLEYHLTDRSLHVVAAPGSGKTVLGLEVFRRLGRPTVVLSPTRTIRDQWVERLGDFLDDEDPADLPWKSRDLAELKFFNSLTYQALHTRMRQAADNRDLEELEAEELEDETDDIGPDRAEISEVVDCFRKAGIGVLILDEAHHLRAEWWAALKDIVEALDDLVLVSLTATPPYDVVGHEWNRYIELCGPIDEEISVPELVRAGTLCPHQDYIRLVQCQGGDNAQLERHHNAVGFLIQDLQVDEVFTVDLAAHPWTTAPEEHVADILRAPDAAIAQAAVLAARDRPPRALMKLLDLGQRDLPELDARLWEQLLRHYLFGRGWPDESEFEQRRSELARRLRAEKLLWRRELNLAEPGRNWPRLSLASEKAQACLDIHNIECERRGDALRQVILTDYIRDEDYQQSIQRELPLGAWPVFHRLVTGASPCRTSALVMHTGRLTIVHHSLVDKLEALFAANGLDVREVPSLSEFRQVRAIGGQRLTRVLTHLLIDGDIQVLVGTRALLGEGWDAPPINSLILASVVGSFMTTNQMRGRAIRIDPADPDKVASIWHIGAFARVGAQQWDLRDLRDMVNRFETFVGLGHKEDIIEGGINRLAPGFWRRDRFCVPFSHDRINNRMTSRLDERDRLASRWQQALDQSEIGRVLPTVRVIKPPRPKVFTFAGTLQVLVQQLIGLAMMVAGAIYYPSAYGTGEAHPGVLLVVMGIGVVLFTLPASIRLAILFFRFLPVDGAVRGIALAVRDALLDAGLLDEAHRNTRLLCTEHASGGWSVALSHGSFSQQSLFAECMQQVLSPIENPRYLVTRQQYRWNRRYADFHAVPTILAARKSRAMHFLKAWQRRVCPAELIYTRNRQGRQALLVARTRAFANARERMSQRIDQWL